MLVQIGKLWVNPAEVVAVYVDDEPDDATSRFVPGVCVCLASTLRWWTGLPVDDLYITAHLIESARLREDFQPTGFERMVQIGSLYVRPSQAAAVTVERTTNYVDGTSGECVYIRLLRGVRVKTGLSADRRDEVATIINDAERDRRRAAACVD